jgi:hypothetical protein
MRRLSARRWPMKPWLRTQTGHGNRANRIFGFKGWNRETVKSCCVLAYENRRIYLAVYIAGGSTPTARLTIREGHGTGEWRRCKAAQRPRWLPSLGRLEDKKISLTLAVSIELIRSFRLTTGSGSPDMPTGAAKNGHDWEFGSSNKPSGASFRRPRWKQRSSASSASQADPSRQVRK